MKQEVIDRRYFMIAKIWSENSYAIRRKVGAIIVKDNMIISDGYNGTPSGFENVCEEIKGMHILSGSDEDKRQTLLDYKNRGFRLVTKPYVLHAEANAISKLAKSNNNSLGATLYVTDEPCLECSKLIIQSGIRRVVYNREYRIHDGIELLKKASIEVEQIEDALDYKKK
nr:MAG TPA: deoxycytidylate deaminase [Caudoviricetes sp.]